MFIYFISCLVVIFSIFIFKSFFFPGLINKLLFISLYFFITIGFTVSMCSLFSQNSLFALTSVNLLAAVTFFYKTYSQSKSVTNYFHMTVDDIKKNSISYLKELSYLFMMIIVLGFIFNGFSSYRISNVDHVVHMKYAMNFSKKLYLDFTVPEIRYPYLFYIVNGLLFGIFSIKKFFLVYQFLNIFVVMLTSLTLLKITEFFSKKSHFFFNHLLLLITIITTSLTSIAFGFSSLLLGIFLFYAMFYVLIKSIGFNHRGLLYFSSLFVFFITISYYLFTPIAIILFMLLGYLFFYKEFSFQSLKKYITKNNFFWFVLSANIFVSFFFLFVVLPVSNFFPNIASIFIKTTGHIQTAGGVLLDYKLLYISFFISLVSLFFIKNNFFKKEIFIIYYLLPFLVFIIFKNNFISEYYFSKFASLFILFFFLLSLLIIDRFNNKIRILFSIFLILILLLFPIKFIFPNRLSNHFVALSNKIIGTFFVNDIYLNRDPILNSNDVEIMDFLKENYSEIVDSDGKLAAIGIVHVLYFYQRIYDLNLYLIKTNTFYDDWYPYFGTIKTVNEWIADPNSKYLLAVIRNNDLSNYIQDLKKEYNLSFLYERNNALIISK